MSRPPGPQRGIRFEAVARTTIFWTILRIQVWRCMQHEIRSDNIAQTGLKSDLTPWSKARDLLLCCRPYRPIWRWCLTTNLKPYSKLLYLQDLNQSVCCTFESWIKKAGQISCHCPFKDNLHGAYMCLRITYVAKGGGVILYLHGIYR
jgi:hypothetical protein